MTAPKPPPRTLQPDDERKVQRFLERAAPIVLEDPQLTVERWRVLAALATEMDLTAEQFRSTIDDLLQRGVIKRLELTPPKPPPLPGRLAGTAAASADKETTEDFALTPPGTPPPVQVSPPADRAPRTIPIPSSAAPSTPQSTPSAAASRSSRPPRERFLDRAKAILAEQRGFNAKSQMLLAAAAQELGMSETEGREALESLLRSPESAGTTGAGELASQAAESDGQANAPADRATAASSKEKLASTRWRVEGAPAPLPPPPKKTPAEIFLEFARPSLAAARDGVVTVELEQRILAHATRVLGLSAVYARHLLVDLVTERKMRFASPTASPTAKSPTETADPRLVDFLQAAAPILAQHRGLTPQSRVLLTALARERGLTEQDVDRAISTLAAREPVDARDQTRQERLTPFKAYIESQLKKSSRGILMPSQYERLAAAGVELFGLENELAATTIRETAGRLQVAVITHEQAEQHVKDLLQDLLPVGVQLTTPQRERLELEGAQWGLQVGRVGSLVEAHCQQNARQLQSEEKFTRLALSAAVVALVLVVTFVAWNAVSRSRPTTSTVPSPPPSSIPLGTRTPVPTKSWLDSDSDLAIAVVNTRTDLPLLRPALNELGANDPARRNTAYDTLVDYFLRQAMDDRRRRDLSELVSRCVAIDPATDSAGRVLTALLRDIPAPAEKLELDPVAFPRMFWGVRAVANALSQAKGQPDRVSQIVAALHRALGAAPDPALPSTELEHVCLQSLAERLFRVLISAAGGPLVNAVSLHAALVDQATKYLDAAQLEKLNAEFLATALATDSNRWPEFEDLLGSTAAAHDPLAVLKLVELYEETDDSPLRDLLGKLLLLRTPGTPPGSSVEEVATFVRQGLGITDSQDSEGIWTKLSRDALDVLSKAAAPPEPEQPLLAEILRLAHYATLACAFAENEWGNSALMERRKSGPKAPETGMEAPPSSGADAAISSPPPPTIDRSTAEALRANIGSLVARRTQPSDRLAAFAKLTQLTDLVPDLPPDAAAVVAAYLLGNKSSSEHSAILAQLPPLAKWNQLLVALADRIEEGTLHHGHLQSLLTTLLSREVILAEGKEGRVAARHQLLQFILGRVGASGPSALTTATLGENTAAWLADAYRLQAQVLKVTIPESAGNSKDPQVAVRVLIDEFSSRLAAAKLTDPQRLELTRVPHELVAAEFLANTDVQRLVAHERIWLRILAVEAARRNAAHAAEAQELVLKLQVQDREAHHILAQVRDGQAALLQMWLLLGKKG